MFQIAKRKCFLTLDYVRDGPRNYVAEGYVALHPKDEVVKVHGQVVQPYFKKVCVEMVYEGHEKDPLPVPVGDELVVIKDAVSSFVIWPELQIHNATRVPVLTYPYF